MAKFPETTFFRGCKSLDHLPTDRLFEVCFAGRSNVGKSSLLNALTGKRDLARASNTPGRTRELNYFLVGEKFYLVDLPGYGYAEAPKHEIKQWTRLTREYLQGRPTLKRVFLLIDSRHGIKENDEDIMAMFDETAVNYQIILTKADKISVAEQEACVAKTLEAIAKHGAAYPQLILTSSEKGAGLETLRREIYTLMSA
jgi:GTP-binding protein